jgi:hypothetical protein
MKEKKPTEKTNGLIAVLFFIGAMVFFILAAGGQVIFGPKFYNTILLAPAWGMLFVPIFYVVGVRGINALVSILKVIAAGIAAAPSEKDTDDE